MKKDEVRVGEMYRVKVSGAIVPVRITAEKWAGSEHRGWMGVNTATHRPVRIRSAQRLRPAVDAGPPAGGDAAPDALGAAGEVPAGAEPQRPSALSAAAQVLAGSAQPMGVKALIAEMGARGLWSSPGGKTPHATLAAAIQRDIAAKGRRSRFRKAGRGLYAAGGR